MNAITPPSLDLDAQIAQAEARLIAREAGLRQEWNGLVRRTRSLARPGRWAWPLGLAGIVAVGWLWALRRRPANAVPSVPQARPVHWIWTLPWASLLAQAWPLLRRLCTDAALAHHLPPSKPGR